MDLKINVGSALSPKEVIVSKSLTVRELFEGQSVSFNEGQVTHNGANLSSAQMDQTLEQNNVEDGDYIVAVSKHSNG